MCIRRTHFACNGFVDKPETIRRLFFCCLSLLKLNQNLLRELSTLDQQEAPNNRWDFVSVDATQYANYVCVRVWETGFVIIYCSTGLTIYINLRQWEAALSVKQLYNVKVRSVSIFPKNESLPDGSPVATIARYSTRTHASRLFVQLKHRVAPRTHRNSIPFYRRVFIYNSHVNAFVSAEELYNLTHLVRVESFKWIFLFRLDHFYGTLLTPRRRYDLSTI